MKRSIGIYASIVIAVIGCGIFILLGILQFIGPRAPLPSPPPGQPIPPIPIGVVLEIMSTIYIGSGIWGLISAVGIYRLKNWARLCFVVFGGLLAAMSLAGLFGALVGLVIAPPTLPSGERISSGVLTVAFATVGSMALVGAALGVWWVIYFNRAAVRMLFTGGKEPDASSRPLSITVIAWLLIVGGVASLSQLLLFSFPLFFLGFIVHGLMARLLYGLLGIVSLSAGIGMLRKQLTAYSLALGYLAFTALNAAVAIASPGSFQRFLQELPNARQIQMTPAAFFVVVNVPGLLILFVVLYFLWTRRRRFIETCRSESLA